MQTDHETDPGTDPSSEQTPDPAEFERALGASYRLLEFIDRGASGEVWKAIDRRTNEVVAAKLLRAEHVADRDLVARFVQERSLLTGLRHSNLVAVRDLVVEGDRLAIIMDFVDGGSLRDVVRDLGTLPPALAAGVVAAVLDGLAAAHTKRLVHRDIKPDNVLLAQGWRALGEGSVKVTDFGIARIIGDGPRTTTGLLGTPEYMSPELLQMGFADRPADVYGIGILLYELLAGRTPFAGPGTDYSVAHRHVSNEPPPIEVPEGLQQVLDAMLDKDPSRRPAARDAADQLRRLVPTLAEVPALPRQAAPDEFVSSRGPVTQVRGLKPSAPVEDEEDDEPRVAFEDLDLGTPGSSTVVRPMARREVRPVRRHVVADEVPKVPWYRDLRVVGGIAGTLLLIVGVVLIVTKGLPGGGKESGPAAQTSFTATQSDPALPSGLSIKRSATYDAEAGRAELTISYSGQRAPLTGPFLEIIPAAEGAGCPTVTWKERDQQRNLPTVTGIDSDCPSWSIDPGPIEPQADATVTATISLELPGQDPQTELQAWVDAIGAATTKAVSDPQVTSTSYPVQRLQGIQIEAPSQTVTAKTLPLTVVPVWPKGPDKLNPIYRSPAVGEASSLLVAIAGGEEGVRFTGGCNGAITVSSDGLVVTTLNVSDQCEVNGQVGNFSDLKSNAFSIASRGG